MNNARRYSSQPAETNDSLDRRVITTFTTDITPENSTRRRKGFASPLVFTKFCDSGRNSRTRQDGTGTSESTGTSANAVLSKDLGRDLSVA